jgi:hypothetical protein
MLQNLGAESALIGKIRYVIHTSVGEGPQEVNDHLLSNDGLPLSK